MSNCDIIIQNLNIASGQSYPLPSGGPANFKFQIANYTNYDSQGFNVSIKKDGEVGGTFYVSKVPAMTEINYPLEISGVIGGTHVIEIEASYNDLNLENNKVSGTFTWEGIPNLQTVITNNVPTTLELCQETNINFRVNNFSYDHVPGTTRISVMINGQPSNLAWEKVDFQARTYIEESFNIHFNKKGTYNISIVADSLTVDESNENDNLAEVTFTVKEAPRLYNDVTTSPTFIDENAVHWYYAQFEKDGKANFYLEPLISSLDVDLEIFKDSPTGEQIAKEMNGAGIPDLVSQLPIQAGIKYYIKVSHYSGSGNYLLRCKNYPTSVTKAYVIARIKTSSTPVRQQADFYSSTSYGSVSFNEEVTVLSQDGPFTKIEYSTSNGLKQGYIYSKYLQPLDTKDQPITPSSVGNWYNPYSDGYEMTQAFNDLDTNLQGHLGHDICKSGSNVPIKAIFAGTVVSAKNSGSNGYMVQIKHTIGSKEFYSFYSHMKENSFTVDTTDKKKVVAGQQLGVIGDTGGNWGAHLHLGVYTGPESTSPYGYFGGGSMHIKDFNENDPSDAALALENATITSATKGTRIFYDLQEVLRTKGDVIV